MQTGGGGSSLGRRTEPASPRAGEQCDARWAARGGVDGRRTPRSLRPSAPAGRATWLPTPCPRSLPDGQQAEERPPSCHHRLILHSQDPEFQKHAAQILRDMLRQEERELQVRSPPRTGRPP